MLGVERLLVVRCRWASHEPEDQGHHGGTLTAPSPRRDTGMQKSERGIESESAWVVAAGAALLSLPVFAYLLGALIGMW